MDILAITAHEPLVDRLRTAFEGRGHRIIHLPDPLCALAGEAWTSAQAVLVDRDAEPLDGLRFSALLRGESRLLFQSLPLFLIRQAPPDEAEAAASVAAGVDGQVLRDATIQQLLDTLGPALGGTLRPVEPTATPVLAAGVPAADEARMREVLLHFRFDLHACAWEDLVETREAFGAPLVLLGLGADPLAVVPRLEALRRAAPDAYPVVFGPLPGEADQRRILLAGAAEWLTPPLSGPFLLHACRRALEWRHARAVHREFERHLHDLQERRLVLEMEAVALRDEVLTDPLTGLLNRRAFHQNLEHHLNQWERHKRGFVLILADVDHFKLINDRFGHMSGDRVLEALSARLRHTLRRSDLAFRIGGEEFAVLLPETTLRPGAEVAEKLRRRIEEEPVLLESGQAVFPSMSFGVGFPVDNDPGAFYSAVDRALYAAKHRGRNCVVAAADPPLGGRAGLDSAGLDSVAI
jgi:diguanylate cyclase (GGDEF)-like protein